MSTDIIAVTLEGRTTAEKQIHLVERGSTELKMYAATLPGAVGKAGRKELAEAAFSAAIKRACAGSYSSIGEILALTLNTPVTIAGRRGFESLKSVFEYEILKMESTPSKGLKKDGAPTPKRRRLEWAIQFLDDVYKQVDAHHAQRAAEREAAKAEAPQIENQ